MKVKDLIKELSKYDGNKDVYLSIDMEGNGYKKLHDLSELVVDDGEVYLPKLTEKMKKEGYTEEDVRKGETSIILWP